MRVPRRKIAKMSQCLSHVILYRSKQPTFTIVSYIRRIKMYKERTFVGRSSLRSLALDGGKLYETFENNVSFCIKKTIPSQVRFICPSLDLMCPCT